MQTLIHKMWIFNPAWGNSTIFSVGTLKGYQGEYGKSVTLEDEQKHLDRNEPIAWVVKRSSCICADKGFYERMRVEQDSAIPVAAGEEVIIEGRHYITKMMGKNYSDGIHFTLKEDV